MPIFEWTDIRPTSASTTFYVKGAASDPFVFRADDGPLYTDGSLQLARSLWCSMMAAAVVQVSTGKVIRIAIEREAYPSSAVAEFYGLIYALQHCEAEGASTIQVFTDSARMIASVGKDREGDCPGGADWAPRLSGYLAWFLPSIADQEN